MTDTDLQIDKRGIVFYGSSDRKPYWLKRINGKLCIFNWNENGEHWQFYTWCLGEEKNIVLANMLSASDDKAEEYHGKHKLFLLNTI